MPPIKPNPAGLVVGALTGTAAGAVTYRHARNVELERLPEGAEGLVGAAKARIAWKTAAGATTGLAAGYMGGSVARDLIVEHKNGKGLKDSIKAVFNREGLKTAFFRGGTQRIALQPPPLPGTGDGPAPTGSSPPLDASDAPPAEAAPPEALKPAPDASPPAGGGPTELISDLDYYQESQRLVCGTSEQPGVLAHLLGDSPPTLQVGGNAIPLTDVDAIAEAMRIVQPDGTITGSAGAIGEEYAQAIQDAVASKIGGLPNDKLRALAERIGMRGSVAPTTHLVAEEVSRQALLVADGRSGVGGILEGFTLPPS